MAINLGDAKYTVKLDDKATAKMKTIGTSMKDMGKQMAKIGAIMAAAATAITIALGKMVKDWAAAGDEVAKMAKRTGFGVEALSELRHVAELSGTNINSLEKGVKRMSSTIEDAKDGLETYTRSFDKLGLSIDDIVKMNPEEQFWAIANALAGLEDPTMRAALAQDFFGRAGTDLLPMLAAGADGIAEMRREAHELGIVFDEEAAANAENLTDAMTDVNAAVDGLKFAIVEELAPAITELINVHLLPAIMKLADWWRENEEIHESLESILVSLVSLIERIPEFVDKLKKVYDIYKKIADLPGGFAFIIGVLTGKPFAKAKEYISEGMTRTELMSPPAMSSIPAAAPGAMSLHLTINGNFMGNESGIRQLVAELEPYFGESRRRTSFPSVNVLGYFPGSSAP